MRWSGPILLLFIVYHLPTSPWATCTPSSWRATCTTTWSPGSRCGPVVFFYVAAMLVLGLHLYHGVWSMLQTLGLSHPRYNPLRHGLSHARHPRGGGRQPHVSPGRLLRIRELSGAPVHGTQVQRPRRSPREEVGEAPLRHEAREPGEQAEVPRDRRGLGPGRRLRRRHPGRAGLQRLLLLLPGQPAARPLDRRPGRHQRGQELPERRRQRLPPVLRHGQGRRLPRPRGQRLPPGRGLGEHHRPVRRPGRALRPRVRRPARQPLLRRAPRSRAPSTPGARPASSSCSAPTQALERQIGLGTGEDVHPPRDAGARRGRRQGARHRDPRHGHGRDPIVRRPTP